MENNTINFMKDHQGIDIQDFETNNIVKIYPYRALYGKKEKALIQSGVKTIVRISQNGVKDFYHLKFGWDENKKIATDENRYFEAFYVVDEETQKAIRADSTSFAEDLRRLKTFTLITNNYIPTNEDKPDFFTIGEPFDREKALEGKQRIYWGISFEMAEEPIKRELSDMAFDIDDTMPIAKLVLQDVSTLEQQFDNARLIFWDKHIPLDNVENMKLEVLPYMMIDRITVKGISSDDKLRVMDDIDFTTKSNVPQTVPFMITPISTEQKVEIDTPWFSSRRTIDLFHIRNVLDMQGQFGVKFSDIANKWQIDKTLKEVILDMLLLSYEFLISFANLPRSANGAIDPDVTLGYGNWKAAAIESGNPIDVVTGVWEKWEKMHANSTSTRIYSGQYRIAQAFIAAFSKNIFSKYSIAGGGNDFNKNILPWRFELSQDLPIPNTGTTKNWKLEDFTFKVENENPFFDAIFQHDGPVHVPLSTLLKNKVQTSNDLISWYYTTKTEHTFKDATNKGDYDFSKNSELTINIGGK